MEFSINLNGVTKCHSYIRVVVFPSRNNRETKKCRDKVSAVVQRILEGTGKMSENIFYHGGDIPAIYLLFRFLLPQALQLEVFEEEKEMDLYVGSSYDEAQIYKVPVPEEIVQKLKEIVKY